MASDSSSRQQSLLAEAMRYQQAGELEKAAGLYRAILESAPTDPKANHNFGILAVRMGHPAAGLPYLSAALDADPAQGQYWLSYIDALHQAGQWETARQILSLARQHGLTGKETDALALRLQGRSPAGPAAREVETLTRLFNAGKLAKVQGLARKMTTRFPDYWFGWKILGVALQQMGRNEEALAPMRKAVSLAPQDAEAHRNLGIVLRNLGMLNDAEASYLRALKLAPDDEKALIGLAATLHARGCLDEAVVMLQRAVRVNPVSFEALCNLGLIYGLLGRLAEEEAIFRRAVKVHPGSVLAHSNLSTVLRERGKLALAEASARRAIQLDPTFADAQSNLGGIYHDMGRLEKAAICWRLALKARPDFSSAHSNLLFCLTQDATVDAKSLFNEHLEFAKRFEAPLMTRWIPHANSRQPEKKLKVGFVSGDLRTHAVASFIEPLLIELSKDLRISLVAYSNHNIDDDTSRRLRGYFAHWQGVANLTDGELANKVRTDGIDILIDLSGHTARNRLVAFAHKPAPIQVSWIGYPGTTGLRAMDYYLANRHFLPQERFAWQFTEKLVYLPATVPFLPAGKSPDVNGLPACTNGYVTFGSFNRVSKIGREVIAVWSRLLRALPNSRMLIGAIPLDENQETLIQWFAEEGVVRGRLDFQRRCDLDEYLALHRRVDICLDTFPYAGGTTINHALWMGVPTLTIAGETPPSWSGASFMNFVGLGDYVAEDKDDFVEKGLVLARDVETLADIRAGLRARFERSPSGKPALLADAFVRALRIMWRRWCEDLPPESFEVYERDIDHFGQEASQ